MIRKLVINNLTQSDIVVDCANDYRKVIAANSNDIIEIVDVETVRIYKKNKNFSKFCVGQFFMKETLRNVWLFSLILMINFDTVFTIPTAIKHIDVNEKKYHYSIFTVFSLLQVNEKLFNPSYHFHNVVDRRKVIFLNCFYFLPGFIIALILAVVTFTGIFFDFDFSFEAIIIYLLCIGYSFIFIKLIKSVNKFRNFSKYSIEEIKNIKPVKIKKESWRYIRYAEY